MYGSGAKSVDERGVAALSFRGGGSNGPILSGGSPAGCMDLAPSLLMNEVLRLFRSEAEAQTVRFCLEVPRQDVWIMGDGRRLQRVLINLIHNALKYSPPGGAIMIAVEVNGEQASQEDSVAESSDGSTVTVRIQDEGPGIAPEDLPHLFEMFFRKKDGHDYRIGRGLGLHFCRLVVEAHCGRSKFPGRHNRNPLRTGDNMVGRQHIPITMHNDTAACRPFHRQRRTLVPFRKMAFGID